MFTGKLGLAFLVAAFILVIAAIALIERGGFPSVWHSEPRLSAKCTNAGSPSDNRCW